MPYYPEFPFIDSKSEQFVENLRRLCKQPSIAAQGVGMEECSAIVAEMTKDAGLKTTILKDHGGFPVVYGELLKEKARQTLLLYDHYDVQPPEPLDEWISDPFSAELRDGKIFARGVADNKGNIVARLEAIQSILNVRGELPLNVKFLVEGEEEIGSPTLPSFVRKHRDLLRADGCIWEAGYKDAKDRPTISLGAKGLLYVELVAKGASVDMHSSYGTIVQNPAWRLIRALNSIKDTKEHILIDGFYDGIVQPTRSDIDHLAKVPFEEEELKKRYGVSRFLNDLTGLQAKIAQYFGTACTIDGIISGYTGKGPKTVLPSRASAKVDFRLVPRQRPEDILQKLKRHLSKHGFDDIEVIVHSAYEAARTPITGELAQIVARAAMEVYGVDPVVYPTMAGSGPMYLFTNELGMQTVSIGVGYADSRTHAPNENIRIDDYVQGIKHIVGIIHQFAGSKAG